MTVGSRVFSGKGAREEAAKALTFSVLSWRDDQTVQPRGAFRAFEIVSKGKGTGFGLVEEDQRVPDLFVRSRATYSANLNATNPGGTVQSIEHTLRNLDRLAAEQQNRVVRIEKELRDYQSQADRPFEHEERLRSNCSPASPNSIRSWTSTKATNKGPTPFPIQIETNPRSGP